MRDLTTEREVVNTVRPSPRTIRVLPITDREGTTRYYMNDLPLPVPAWMQYLDGSDIGSVLATLLLVLLVLAGPVLCAMWMWLARLMEKG